MKYCITTSRRCRIFPVLLYRSRLWPGPMHSNSAKPPDPPTQPGYTKRQNRQTDSQHSFPFATVEELIKDTRLSKTSHSQAINYFMKTSHLPKSWCASSLPLPIPLVTCSPFLSGGWRRRVYNSGKEIEFWLYTECLRFSCIGVNELCWSGWTPFEQSLEKGARAIVRGFRCHLVSQVWDLLYSSSAWACSFSSLALGWGPQDSRYFPLSTDCMSVCIDCFNSMNSLH